MMLKMYFLNKAIIFATSKIFFIISPLGGITRLDSKLKNKYKSWIE